MAETAPAIQQENNKIAKKEKTHSERFAEMVEREFTGTAGNLSLTSFQKRLVQNYFITIDQSLKKAEQQRLKKDERFRDTTPLTWEHINMELLAINVVACARIGFDPALSNHINMVPYKNNALKKYDIVFIEGYRGKELKARKYGFDVPNDIIIELVYSTDTFSPIKKDKDNRVETYEFKVNNSFERGEIIGGFYYFSYFDSPEKNKLMFYSKSQIEKRKPEKASAEFWGGEKDKYEWDDRLKKNVKTGTESIEGWYDEMMWKTLSRIAYSNITIDSQKIDDDFIKLSLNEKMVGELDTNPSFTAPDSANSKPLDINYEDLSDNSQSAVDSPTAPQTQSEGDPPTETSPATDNQPNF